MFQYFYLNWSKDNQKDFFKKEPNRNWKSWITMLKTLLFKTSSRLVIIFDDEGVVEEIEFKMCQIIATFLGKYLED